MIGALIQARLGSKRLPNKVLKRVNKRILLEIMMSRLSQSKKLEKIIICTTTNKEDDKIVQFCKKNNFLFYRGSSRDVMSRFLKAANKFNISIIVRLTADCPLIDPKFVDKLIDMGAKIILCDPHRATVIGHDFESQLKSATLTSPDIRAGVSLLIAALSAKGTSTIHNIEQIDRGYEDIENRLQQIGAKIKRINR